MSPGEQRRRIDVALASPALDADALRRCAARLSPDERARADRSVAPGARDLQIVARALLRTTLSRHADVAPEAWTFERGVHGKPHVAGPDGAADLRFSLSHTEGLVAVAVTQGCEVGIDVERVDGQADIAALAAVVLSPAERTALGAAPEAERRRRFFALWTLKEAYLKARGRGLLDPPERVVFDLSRGVATADFALPADQPRWSFWRASPTDDHVLALAAPSGAIEVTLSWRPPGGEVRPRTGVPRRPPPAGRTPWRRAS